LEASNGALTKWTLANTILGLMTAGALLLLGWVLDSVIDLREFAAKGDRWTRSDALTMQRETLERMDNRYHPANHPPHEPEKWLINELEELHRRIADIEEEDKRLQLQHDRWFEGHNTKTYTEDAK